MTKQVIEFLYAFICMTFVWILVTLITDWSAVFYRKHIVYKRRMGEELMKKGASLNGSITTLNTS